MNHSSEPAPLIPVSFLNAYIYCPRRFFLEFNMGLFEDNFHTIEGRRLHRTVDDDHRPAHPDKKADVIHRRSVQFSSAKLGVIGKIDLLEENNCRIYPVEYKKGKKPKNASPWLNDQVQLCAQALLMRDNQLPLPETAYLYYIGSKARVEVPISDTLMNETLKAIDSCHAIAAGQALPPLAENRNKCFSCSLNAICLPEEEEVSQGSKTNARKIIPQLPDGEVLYVDTIGAYIGLSENNLKITTPDGNTIPPIALEKLREVTVAGPVQITTQAISACLKNNIPISYLSFHGRFLGLTTPMMHFNGITREAQWKGHFDPLFCLEFAKSMVTAKLLNMKTLMRRYLKDTLTEADRHEIDLIKLMIKEVKDDQNLDSLRGHEGIAARHYFSCFARFIKPDKQSDFPFTHRNRRPPRDPVNAMLSFGYSLLSKDCLSACLKVGLDPFCGYFHVMKYGRPSLALDIMECFRQPIVDSVVLSSINNGVFRLKDFYQYQNTCYLNESGRKKFLAQYEMRKRDLVTHPKFHYRLSYSRTIELQCRLLCKYLMKAINLYEGFYIR